LSEATRNKESYVPLASLRKTGGELQTGFVAGGEISPHLHVKDLPEKKWKESGKIEKLTQGMAKVRRL